MKGDPRTQAIIIHEDGWASHSTSSAHSVAAITISNACSTKFDRSSGNSCRVYSFIPVDKLPVKAPHKFDAFLTPLIDEVEFLFLQGKRVFFKSAVEGYSLGNENVFIRVLPLLLTADMKAHAEVGLTSVGVKLLENTLPPTSITITGIFLFRYHNRSAARTAETSFIRGTEVDNAFTTSRKELSKQYGVTVLYRWFFLCKFDPVNDLVIDVMHVILNLVRTELELLLGRGNQLDESRVVNRSKLADALKYVPWISELKDGRLPTIIGYSDLSSNTI